MTKCSIEGRYEYIARMSEDEQWHLDQVNTNSFPRLRGWTPWDEVKPEDFGGPPAEEWDYELVDLADRVAFWPVSTAAEYWLHTHMNWADRWSVKGYILNDPDGYWRRVVMKLMTHHGLISQDEYESNQENEQVLHQEQRT